MAAPADDGAPWRLATLARLLAPQPGRFEFAARLALICALTTLVAEVYHTPEIALTTYVAFFLNKPDRATSAVLGVVMTILISLAIGSIALLAMLVIDDPAWRVASMVGISFVLLFLGSASKLRPVGSTVALVVAYALDLLGSVPVGELATRQMLYSWLFIGIPAGVSMVVNLLLAPSPRKLVERELAHRLRLAAATLRGDAAMSSDLRACLRQGDGEIQARLKLAGAERTSPAHDITALRQAADATIALLSVIDFMMRTPEAMLPHTIRAAAATTLEQMSHILAAGAYPVGVRPDLAGGAHLAPLAAAVLSDLDDAIGRFAEPAPPTGPRSAGSRAEAAGGFFLPDAFTNPDHVRYALKATAAAMFCYLLYTLLLWPGIHTSFLTCYIVSLSTLAESAEKLCLRITGCLVGAALGLAVMIFVIPSITSITALLAIVFLGALLSAWVGAGSTRISYAGFQIAFAFFLCVIQGTGPSFDMVVARDRVIGILIGNCVVYAVSAWFWPVSVAARIESCLASVALRLGLLLQATDRAARLRLAAEVQASLGAAQSDIRLARYEPVAVRPSEDWLHARHDVAQQAGALEAPLRLLAEQGEIPVAAFASRLDQLVAGPWSAETASSPAASHVGVEAAGPATLQAMVDLRLCGLEAAWRALGENQEPVHAPA